MSPQLKAYMLGRISSKPAPAATAPEPVDQQQQPGSPAAAQHRAKFPRFRGRKKEKRNTSADSMDTQRQHAETPMDVVQEKAVQDGDSLNNDEIEPTVNGNGGIEDSDLMDTGESEPLMNAPGVDGLLATETLHPASPIQQDVGTEMVRPASSSAESLDGEKIDEDDDSRAEGTIVYTVPDVRKLTDVGTHSLPVQVRNLPWRIMVMKRKGRSSSHLQDDSYTLGYFLQCNVDADSASWTCHANAELRLHPWKSETPTIKRGINHIFYNKENDWGFTNFMQMEDLMDPAKGHVNPQDHSLHLEVTLNADPPHGVCWDSKKYTGYIGLKNQGATCYMNSLLQSLYFTNKLRKAVYLIPTEADDQIRSVPLAVQRVFYELQTSEKPVGTKKLTKSFGWETLDSFMQHDAQELCRVLLDNMDMKMKGTRVEGTIPRLFEGKMISFIRCRTVDYESSREESFMDVQLNVKDRKDVYASFDDYVELEILEGDNKYDAGDHGLQEAEKGIAFLSFPPVLHLQLKRFQFDPVSESNIKINDRFEFPERLDLTKYVRGATVTPPVYFLHAVLVHSGDNHGGHYVVYINPKGDGKWCKFDDDVVVRCTKKEAIEKNYGGSTDEYLQFRNCTNAYMLVYINNALKGEILQSVGENEVPGYLSHRFSEERETEIRRRKEKTDQQTFCTIHVITEDDIAVHQNADLVDLEKIVNNKRVFRIRKDLTCAEFREQLAQWFGPRIKSDVILGFRRAAPAQLEAVKNFCNKHNWDENGDIAKLYKPEDIRYYPWISRPNGSVRPNYLTEDGMQSSDQPVSELITDDETPIFFLEITRFRNISSCTYFNKLPSNRKNNPDELIMLFFRLYDPMRRVLEYKGFDMVSGKISLKELVDCCNSKAGFPSGTSLLVFNDTKVNTVEQIHPTETIGGKYSPGFDVNDGDLIIFQRPVLDDHQERLSLPTVKHYFKDLTFRTEVDFADKERPNDESCSFTLTLNLKMTYNQVVNALAARLKTDPKRIQLYRCQNTAVREVAGSAIQCTSESTLTNLLPSRMSGSKSKKLFYQHLEMDIDELESRKEVKVIWQPNYREEGRDLTVLVNKRGNIGDVLDHTRKMVDLSADGTGQLRLVELTGPRINSILNKMTTLEGINTISGNRIFRVEEIPPDQLKLEIDEHLIAVAHFQKEIHHTFGIPFLIKVKIGEEFSEVKERIRKLLDVPEKEFEKYKFCVCHMGKQIPLDDTTKVNLKELSPYSNPATAFTQIWLGIDHLNRTQKRPRPSYLEKAVKIYN